MQIKYRSFFIVPFFLTGCGSLPEADSVDIQQMIINIGKTIPSLIEMCTAGSYILGFLLMMRAIYKLREYGESRTMMSSQTSIWQPVITLIIASLLIYFPSAYQIGLQTLFGDSQVSPVSYMPNAGVSEELMNAVVLIMQLIGGIAFIRGLLLINSASGHNAQPGSFGKGITFIIGGLLAINIYGTWEVVVNTLVGV